MGLGSIVGLLRINWEGRISVILYDVLHNYGAERLLLFAPKFDCCVEKK